MYYVWNNLNGSGSDCKDFVPGDKRRHSRKTSVKFSKRQLIPNCTIYKMVKIAVELTFENFVPGDKGRHSRKTSTKFSTSLSNSQMCYIPNGLNVSRADFWHFVPGDKRRRSRQTSATYTDHCHQFLQVKYLESCTVCGLAISQNQSGRKLFYWDFGANTTYRVAKTHRIPYLCRSFSAKLPYNLWLFCGKWPVTWKMTCNV